MPKELPVNRSFGRLFVTLAFLTSLVHLSTVRAVSPTQAIDPDNPPKGKFADDWYAVTLHGKKAGHMHSVMSRTFDKASKQDVIETETVMKLILGRGGQSITVSQTEKSTETISGRPLRFASITDMSLMSTKLSGRVDGNKVIIVSTQLGQSVTNTYTLPEGALMSWGTYREQMKHELTPGTSYTLMTYVPSMSPSQTTPTQFEVISPESIDLYGRVVNAMKTRQVMQIKTPMGMMEVVSTAWLDEEQKPLMVEMEMLKQSIRLIQCSKAVAMQEADPPELMADTLIPTTLPANVGDMKEMKYRIRSRDGRGKTLRMPELPRTAMQGVEREADGPVLVTVVKGGCDELNQATTQPSKADLESLKAASAYANINDPEIKKLAKKAAGDEKDPLKLAYKLRAFVTDYIDSKDLSVGFATASEVARSKQGDCSEHAVLLAALARACGLPSRGVSGVAYAPAFIGKRDVFVWHMWTQVYINGRWVDIDAALHQDVPDVTHIALGIIPLADAGVGEMAFPIWNLIGQIQIDAVNEKQ